MITSKNLYFHYEESDSSERAKNVLSDINIFVGAGEFVAILGHNGSGKSTLARHFNALLSPTDGTLWINGSDSKNPENTWQIRQSAGMVFQNPDNQIIATVVEEDIAFGPENLGVAPEEIRARVDETLRTVGMSDYAKFAPHHLSGGQKQRVAIAGVLAMRPGCIVLDEPSAMLDPSARREVMDTITRLNRDGVTIILITHFMEEAARANRIIVMDAGKIAMDDTPRKIFSQVEKMQALGLDVPQVTSLAHALRMKNFSGELPITIDEFIEQFFLRAPDFEEASAKKNQRHEKNFREKNFCDEAKIISAQEKNFSDENFCHEKISPSARSDEAKIIPAQEKNIIELKNVSHVYNANSVFEKIALREINLQIKKGEIVAIIGHTGSGKSTLIQHFNALLSPTDGKIFFDGDEIDKTKIKSVRRRVGLVFQYPEHQLFEVSVYKDVAFGPTRMGLSQEEIEKNTVAALETVGLGEEFYDKSPFEISGGQKRRAAIAGVLAMRPEILVLDEPAAGLDPRGKREIFSQIKKMHEQLGITVILVSHSMEDAA
ncbi:MAG: energy-coupling factor transporter ATPase, partial [Defluviitaleaceae bacterium]|nr:energy-coupling factor transporter ATPase [Defluviitaleaceae bacterium]